MCSSIAACVWHAAAYSACRSARIERTAVGGSAAIYGVDGALWRGSSILEATHRESARPEVVDHEGIAAVEVEAEGGDAINRTAPIAAVGTHIDERTIVVAEAGHGQLKR